MRFSDDELLQRVISQDLRAVARLITLSENRIARANQIQSKLFAHTGRAHVVGITGSPGAGKSTLVDQVARALRLQEKRVAIIAVDPTSPFSGGAVLGDRVRMSKVAEDRGVYIRSMATRGSLGGLSRGTLDAIQILDGAGFEYILVETVGVGQAEVDIMRIAHTCLVVLVPGMGDSVQTMKAGILEIADVFVINKADREGADLLQRDLKVLLSLQEPVPGEWEPPIVRTVATEGTGIKELVQAMRDHGMWFRSSPHGKEHRLQILRHSILELAVEMLRERALHGHQAELDAFVTQCFERKLDPLTAASKLLALGR